MNGVVFDLDGVIVDSHPLHRIAWREFLRTVGKDVDEAALDFVLDGRTRKEILLHFLGPLTDQQLEHYGRLKDELLRTLADEMKTIPGVVEFLDHLSNAGIRIALATSASRQRASGTLHEIGIAHHFQTIVTGDDVAARSVGSEISDCSRAEVRRCRQRDPGGIAACCRGRSCRPRLPRPVRAAT